MGSVTARSLLAFSLFYAGCPAAVQVSNTAVVIDPDAEPSPAPSNVVCNPFDEEHGGAGAGYGLHGRLRYLPDDAPRAQHVADFMTDGIELGADLFLNQVNVPTRPFDQGFVTQNGTVLTRPNGDTLYEWFSLRLESEIKLGDADSPGHYQFALLSDDGSILSVQDPGTGQYAEAVNNDLLTPTRLACASGAIAMSGSSSLPVRIDYYQGPRFHIALMLLWRQVPASSAGVVDPAALQDAACGRSGNGLFFDSTQVPSAAQPMWLGMLDRGWKVLAADNFLLPARFRENPCCDGDSCS